jgi:hypothetical protein
MEVDRALFDDELQQPVDAEEPEEPGAAEAAQQDDGGAAEEGAGGSDGLGAAAAPDRRRLDPGCCALSSVLGFDLSRRHNLVALDSETLAIAAGAGVLLLHLPTMRQRHLPARDGGGVGAVAVHPKGAAFAVAEKRRDHAPNM